MHGFGLIGKFNYYFTQRGMRMRYVFLVVVIVLCLLITGVLFAILQEWNVKRLNTEFGMWANDRASVVKNSADDNITMLESLADFFYASKYVTREEFDEFTKKIFKRHPDILSLSWVPRITAAELPKYIEMAQQDNIAAFAISEYDEKNNVFIAAGLKEEYYPIFYVQPVLENKDYIGLDLSHESERREALERARDTGQAIATGRIRLIPGNEYGSRFFIPIYTKDIAYKTVEERRKNLVGFVSFVVQLRNMTETSLTGMSASGIDVYLYDESASSDKRFLAFHGSRAREKEAEALAISESELRNGLFWEMSFDVGGRKWMVLCKPTEYFFRRYLSWQPWGALIVGIIITVLLGLYLYSSMNYTARAEMAVEKRTAELKNVNEDLTKEITQRKLAEELAHRAREQAELIYKITPNAIFTVDRDQRITSWNNKAAEITGYTFEEVAGKKCSIFASFPCSGDCGLFNENTAKPVMGEECTIKRKDGRVLYISKNSDYLKDLNGHVIGGIESFNDITERKKEIEKLLYLTLAVEQSPAVVVITDTKGNIQYVNPRFQSITGYTLDEMMGKNPRTLKSGELPGVIYKSLWNAISAGKTWQGEFHNKKKNGEFFWETALISPIVDASGVTIGFLKVAEDITARKEAETRLEKAMKDLEAKNIELQKLDKLKTEFVSVVSHELRTPLSITKEGISLVLDKIPGPVNEKQARVLSVAKDNIDRLARIINNLLDISKIEAGKVELKKVNVDITALVRQVMQSFEISAKQKNLGLKMDLPDKNVYAFVDSDRILQVITNLVGNSIKFTENGYIEVILKETAHDFECSVTDTGIGISKTDLPKVFEKFQQFSRTPGAGAKGTGLGLSIVKGIVEMHNGKIFVESELGKGSRFTFIIPKQT